MSLAGHRFTGNISLVVLLTVLFSLPLNAQDHSTSQADPEFGQTGSVNTTAVGENPASNIPYETGGEVESTCENRWSKFLPILGQAACERGYVLPRPFGVSLGYMHQDQPFDVGNILVGGIDVKTPGLAIVNEVQNRETTYTLRFDAWILPFWNIYGILGKTNGRAAGPIQVSLEPVFPLLCRFPGNNCEVNSTFKLDYKANVKGYGTTIAGGYKEFFAMIDLNWTKADLNISLTDARAKVISSRIGWNGEAGKFKGVLWAGAMYQDVSQTMDLPLDLGSDVLLVSIGQSTQEAYNYLIGGQWDINRSLSVLAEFGFGKRKSRMLNLTYRF